MPARWQRPEEGVHRSFGRVGGFSRHREAAGWLRAASAGGAGRAALKGDAVSCPGPVTCMRSLMAFQTLPAAEVLLEDALAFGTAFCPPSAS